MSDAQTDVAALVERLRWHACRVTTEGYIDNVETKVLAAAAATLESQARELAEARRERDELRAVLREAWGASYGFHDNGRAVMFLPPTWRERVHAVFFPPADQTEGSKP
jgi:hypothetical protein